MGERTSAALLRLLPLRRFVPTVSLTAHPAAPMPTEMEERKAALIEALAAKCAALLELQQAGGSAPAATATAGAGGEQPQAGGVAGEPGRDSAFEAAFKELRKWVDTAADEKVC